MTDRPILFSAPMVNALLGWRKTQTRRLATSPLRRVAVGDRLWVREAYANAPPYGSRYPATDAVHELRRIYPSIFMPRWASRLTLTVTELRRQRLWAITEADAVAEGIQRALGDGQHYINLTGGQSAFAANAYGALWNSLHRDPGTQWAANPEIIALTFSVVQRNIDA